MGHVAQSWVVTYQQYMLDVSGRLFEAIVELCQIGKIKLGQVYFWTSPRLGKRCSTGLSAHCGAGVNPVGAELLFYALLRETVYFSVSARA